eukprot:1707331-Prymnesium_polylepis.1
MERRYEGVQLGAVRRFRHPLCAPLLLRTRKSCGLRAGCRSLGFVSMRACGNRRRRRRREGEQTELLVGHWRAAQRAADVSAVRTVAHHVKQALETKKVRAVARCEHGCDHLVHADCALGARFVAVRAKGGEKPRQPAVKDWLVRRVAQQLLRLDLGQLRRHAPHRLICLVHPQRRSSREGWMVACHAQPHQQ